MIHLIQYEEKYHEDFRRLNLEWLQKFDILESHDLHILDDPQQTVLDNGGCIYLAKYNDEIVGSAGLANEGNGVFELIKMAVTAAFQGRGISRLLIEKCLAAAKEKGAQKIILFSNSQLVTAIELYKKYGFKHVDATDAPFATADVKMELSL